LGRRAAEQQHRQIGGLTYRRVAEAFPEAWIEDPELTAETEPILAPHRDRITWDAPIHAVADIEALPFAPKTINIKPSRFGSIEEARTFCQDFFHWYNT